MNSDQEFAEGVYEIITAFLSGIETIKSLEKYYRNNISAIHSIKEIDLQLYNKTVLIKLLGERGRQLQKKKLNVPEKQELESIERVIRQLAFGRDEDQTS